MAEQFGVRRQRAGADAEDEPALREMIEHRRMGGDQHGMGLRQVGGAGRELDLPRFGNERGQELEAVGHILDHVSNVFATKRVVEAELVSQDEGLAVFLQGLDPVAMRWMHRHGEKAKSHCFLPCGLRFSNMIMITKAAGPSMRIGPVTAVPGRTPGSPALRHREHLCPAMPAWGWPRRYSD